MTNQVEQIKDELQGLSLDVVEWLREVVPKGKDFVVDQTPAVIQEIVTRAIALSGLGLFFGLVLGAVGIIFIRIAINYKPRDKWDESGIGYWFGGIIPSIAGVILTSIFSYKLVYVLSAPKLFILEYLKDLL